jgi:hypothetical protein
MPVGDGEPQVILQGFAVDDLVGVVVLEREGILGFRAVVGDLGNLGEVSRGFFHEKGAKGAIP